MLLASRVEGQSHHLYQLEGFMGLTIYSISRMIVAHKSLFSTLVLHVIEGYQLMYELLIFGVENVLASNFLKRCKVLLSL